MNLIKLLTMCGIMIAHVSLYANESTFPFIAKCKLDNQGNIIEILDVKNLGQVEIDMLYEATQQTMPFDDYSLEQAFGYLVNATLDFSKGVCLIVYTGGKYLLPKVVKFTKETTSNAYDYLQQQYHDYMNNKNTEEVEPLATTPVTTEVEDLQIKDVAPENILLSVEKPE